MKYEIIKINDKNVSFIFDEKLFPEGKGIEDVLKYHPFISWMQNIEKGINIASIQLQNVDYFGNRVGFIKFKCNAYHSNGVQMPGIVFMRGDTVTILIILVNKHTKEEYVLFVRQPRVPIGKSSFPELPAGMVDGGNTYVDQILLETSEETGIDLSKKEIIDLTKWAFQDRFNGVYPSPGGCDECIRFYLHRVECEQKFIESLMNKHTGIEESGEIITLHPMQIDLAFFMVPDAKFHTAMNLYRMYQKFR